MSNTTITISADFEYKCKTTDLIIRGPITVNLIGMSADGVAEIAGSMAKMLHEHVESLCRKLEAIEEEA